MDLVTKTHLTAFAQSSSLSSLGFSDSGRQRNSVRGRRHAVDCCQRTMLPCGQSIVDIIAEASLAPWRRISKPPGVVIPPKMAARISVV